MLVWNLCKIVSRHAERKKLSIEGMYDKKFDPTDEDSLTVRDAAVNALKQFRKDASICKGYRERRIEMMRKKSRSYWKK